MKYKAIIFGIKGTKLSTKEKKLLRKKPWGVILFARNIKNIFQLKLLIENIKKTTKDKNYPILIDQEGGDVCRLNNIVDFSLFSQSFLGKMYKLNKKKFFYSYHLYIKQTCDILNNVGININTVPVLDIKREKTHKIIKNRSFGYESSLVSKIGKLCINNYKKNRIATVTKHIPGHGLSKYDSHLKLPIVRTSAEKLKKKDFKPFKECKSLFAMTAHIIYSAYDAFNPATHSKIIINKVIRKHMNFKGILISDDISMKALKYNVYKNATKALDAGCNLVLHCNGNIKEMNKLIKDMPIIDNFTQKKTSDFKNFLG